MFVYQFAKKNTGFALLNCKNSFSCLKDFKNREYKLPGVLWKNFHGRLKNLIKYMVKSIVVSGLVTDYILGRSQSEGGVVSVTLAVPVDGC